MILLKQSTAATVRVGPFVDATNAVTPETGITLVAADQAELLKHTGATVDISGATWAAITGCDGYYDLSLTTSHTDTLGMLTIVVQDASVCVPVPPVRAMVLPAQVFDSIVGGTDLLDVNAAQLGGTSQTGRDVGASVLISPGTGAGQLDVTSGAIKIQSGYKRNTAITDFVVLMTDSTNHNPAAGLTVTAQYSHDGGDTFSSAGTVTESTATDGHYHVDLTSTAMNAPKVLLKFTASGADTLSMLLSTDP